MIWLDERVDEAARLLLELSAVSLLSPESWVSAEAGVIELLPSPVADWVSLGEGKESNTAWLCAVQFAARTDPSMDSVSKLRRRIRPLAAVARGWRCHAVRVTEVGTEDGGIVFSLSSTLENGRCGGVMCW